MTQPTPLLVVCAVIEDGAGRVLVAQRPNDKHMAKKWEFAGGKIEAQESPEAALVREIKEELGCDIVVGRGLPRFTHDYSAVLIKMVPFVCTLRPESPAPQPREHIAIQWVVPSELRKLDLAPADWPVVDAYLAYKG